MNYYYVTFRSHKAKSSSKRLYGLGGDEMVVKHQYAWPDADDKTSEIVLAVCTELSKTKLRELLDSLLEGDDYRATNIDGPVDPMVKPFKYNRETKQEYETLKEYMGVE